jgi:glycine cleavage system H protein
MAKIPSDLYYTEEHEYLKPVDEDGVFLVGVTDYAQGELGDVVFVELPEPGVQLKKMEVFGTIEAVKANAGLDDDPSLVNADPYGDGWMIRLKVANPADLEGLLRADGYAEHIA